MKRALVPLLLLTACAHGPAVTEKEAADPRGLLANACGEKGPGAGIRQATGSVWMKASSKEASGKFPAQVLAEAPDRLTLEVMNLVGGKEALIQVTGRKYMIEVTAQKNRGPQKQEGYHSWAGIPLQFATELFLGRVPCPPPGSLEDAHFKAGAGDELIVETKASLEREPELYRYTFESWDGHPWPKGLHWEKKGTVPSSVDFKFEYPERSSGSPTRWEAKSSLGEVNVRWRQRELTR